MNNTMLDSIDPTHITITIQLPSFPRLRSTDAIAADVCWGNRAHGLRCFPFERVFHYAGYSATFYRTMRDVPLTPDQHHWSLCCPFIGHLFVQFVP